MKNLIKILALIIITAVGCNQPVSNEAQKYSEIPLVKWLNDYSVEKDEPNYSDNLIYNDCLEVTFEYSYEKNGKIKYFKQNGIFSEWEFITEKELNNGVGVKWIKLTSKNPNESFNNAPQSVIQYEFINSKNQNLGFESTGVIENYSNVVKHNTRSGFFRPLFSFPWPSVKFPIENNKTWNWKFAYDSSVYGDDRIYNWDGITEMKYDYNYWGDTTLTLQFGDVVTSKYEAFGTNGEIENRLIYFFNSKIGFVKQEFYTHDGTKIVIEAVDYQNKCNEY